MIQYNEIYWGDVERVLCCIPNLKNLKHKSILITGATGLICSSVVDILLYLNRKQQAGNRIILAGRSQERTKNRFCDFMVDIDYEFIYYDATTDQEIEAQVDYIIHGASNANPAVYTKEPVETMLANIIGLNKLLFMAARMNVQRLLYVSSSEVYGSKQDVRFYHEGDYGFVDILNPRAAYPSAKRAAETLCIAYSEEYQVDTIIVRPGHIYGPSITESDDRASAQFTRAAVQGKDIVMKSAGNQLRSYCYTLDCASAILVVLLNGEKGSAYNISNKNSVVSIRNMAEALATTTGTKIVFQNPSDIEAKGYNLMNNSALEAKRLERLGWHACFDLYEGVEHMVRVYKENKV